MYKFCEKYLAYIGGVCIALLCTIGGFIIIGLLLSLIVLAVLEDLVNIIDWQNADSVYWIAITSIFGIVGFMYYPLNRLNFGFTILDWYWIKSKNKIVFDRHSKVYSEILKNMELELSAEELKNNENYKKIKELLNNYYK